MGGDKKRRKSKKQVIECLFFSNFPFKGKKRGRVRSLDQTREKLKRKKLFNKEVLIE
jgi:hypothetical protein